MGIFDRFKKSELEESEAKEELEKATEQYDSNAYQEALRTLSWGFRKDVNYKPLYELSAKCLEKLEAVEEAELFREVLRSPKKFESYRNLGAHFYEAGHYDLALPFLEKAVRVDSSYSDTVHDLAIVYSRRFQIDKAVKVLEANNPQDDFWNYWFWCKLRILAGRTTGVREELNELIVALDDLPNQDEAQIPRQKVEEVLELLTRHEQIENHRIHIQDWHFIQYGNIIIDYFEDSDEYVAGGRYVAAWGSNESIKQLIAHLKEYFEVLELNVDKVVWLNTRDSKILGLAIGYELGLETQVYDPNQINQNALIVGANSFDFDDRQELATVQNGQVLFALNHDWLRPSSISPDIVGLMSQAYYYPWNGGGIKVLDAEKGLTEKTELDERSEEDIARDVFSENVESSLESEYLEFYRSNKEYLKAIGTKANKHRFNFMIESPVPGSYFS